MRLTAILILLIATGTAVSGQSLAEVAAVGTWTGPVGDAKGQSAPATLTVNRSGDYKVEYGDKACVVMLERTGGHHEDVLHFEQKVVHGRCAHNSKVSIARGNSPDRLTYEWDAPNGAAWTGTLTRITTAPAARPEHGPEPVRLQPPRGKFHEFLYAEASPASAAPTPIGVEPIDILSQQLIDENYKCLNARQLNVGNSRMILQRRTTQINFDQFGYKRYVVHCTGDCDDLEYHFETTSEITHFAGTSPVPMLALQSRGLGSNSIRFHIPAAAAASREAVVRIFQWSMDRGDYGLGCGSVLPG